MEPADKAAPARVSKTAGEQEAVNTRGTKAEGKPQVRVRTDPVEMEPTQVVTRAAVKPVEVARADIVNKADSNRARLKVRAHPIFRERTQDHRPAAAGTIAKARVERSNRFPKGKVRVRVRV